jgi:rhodanese-related sulfurtransferase
MTEQPSLITLTPAQAHELAAKGEVQLVDVREDNEWAAARIPGAIHAALSRLGSEAADLPNDKPVVFYCMAGARSAKAVEIARSLGLAHIRHMGGGISAWNQAGYEIER